MAAKLIKNFGIKVKQNGCVRGFKEFSNNSISSLLLLLLLLLLLMLYKVPEFSCRA